MRCLLIATVVFLSAAASAFAQAPTCPSGQTYDQTQKKCVSSNTNSNNSRSGY